MLSWSDPPTQRTRCWSTSVATGWASLSVRTLACVVFDAARTQVEPRPTPPVVVGWTTRMTLSFCPVLADSAPSDSVVPPKLYLPLGEWLPVCLVQTAIGRWQSDYRQWLGTKP